MNLSLALMPMYQ
jgi:small subunit ribosomal protein S12